MSGPGRPGVPRFSLRVAGPRWPVLRPPALAGLALVGAAGGAAEAVAALAGALLDAIQRALAGARAPAQEGGQRLDRRVAEHVRHAQLLAGLGAQPVEHVHHQERVAPEVEEV